MTPPYEWHPYKQQFTTLLSLVYLISPKKHSFCCKNGCSDYDLSAFLVREKVPIASRTMAPKQAVMTL